MFRLKLTDFSPETMLPIENPFKSLSIVTGVKEDDLFNAVLDGVYNGNIDKIKTSLKGFMPKFKFFFFH